mmetsp:Transcript_15745/g.43018  ORF Transcript_15745/g.43018 Transcript_15745/m.43018 type:complete len:225 (+) Transcript_15745:1943-2617(+)
MGIPGYAAVRWHFVQILDCTAAKNEQPEQDAHSDNVPNHGLAHGPVVRVPIANVWAAAPRIRGDLMLHRDAAQRARPKPDNATLTKVVVAAWPQRGACWIRPAYHARPLLVRSGRTFVIGPNPCSIAVCVLHWHAARRRWRRWRIKALIARHGTFIKTCPPASCAQVSFSPGVRLRPDNDGRVVAHLQRRRQIAVPEPRGCQALKRRQGFACWAIATYYPVPDT